MMCSQKRWFVTVSATVLVMYLAAVRLDLVKYTRGGSDNHPTNKNGRVKMFRFQESRNDTLEGSKLDRTSPPSSAPWVMGCMDLESLDRDKALVLGHHTTDKGFLTIGITTVERKNVSYLHRTLQSLINNADDATERSRLRIVVFACDFKEQARQEAQDIVSSFPEHVQSGLLQLIEAPKSFYPPLTNLKVTFNNTEERVRWRSKENIDNAFIFAYSVGMSGHYLQLDDDFIIRTKRTGYIRTIRDFIVTHENDHWALLDISNKGTGKLFRDEDLLQVARFLVQFYQEQPVDYLFSYLIKLNAQKRRFVVNPPLFRHLGRVSSLEVKNQGRRRKKQEWFQGGKKRKNVTSRLKT